MRRIHGACPKARAHQHGERRSTTHQCSPKGALDAPATRPHITTQTVDRGTDAVRNLKHTLMAAGLILLVAWAVLLVMHILFALVWVFFWVGLVGILVAVVLHAVEHLV